jgi:hypothetical protein
MTTTAKFVANPSTGMLRKRRLRRFFPGMALFALAVLIFAFVPEYVQYSRGSFPIAWVLHVHGAIMAAWIGVFLLQAYLGATGRITQHRKTGNFAFVVGSLAWVSMIFVEWRALLVKAPSEDIRDYDGCFPVLTSISPFRCFSRGHTEPGNDPSGTNAL